MGRRSTGARLREYGIADDVVDRFLDFREARRGVECQLVQDALELFIANELKRDRGLKARFEALRKARGRR